MGVSLAVADQKASAFADDVDATIVQARFVDDFDYGGTQQPCVACRVEFQVDGADETFVQNYTLGDALIPCDDGNGLEAAPGKDAKGIGANTNLGKFLASLVSSGLDDEELAKNDISILDGLHVHLLAEARKLSEKDKKAGKKPSSVLLVNKIHDEPFEAAKPTKGKAAAAKPAAKAAAPAKGKAKVDPIKEATDAAVLAVIEAAGGSIAASKLSTPLFKAVKSENDVATTKKIVALGTSDEYLSGDDAPFDFDGTTLSLKE
jgi:hypothetical protein